MDPSASECTEAGELQAALLPVSFPFCLCSGQHQQHKKGRNHHTSNECLGLVAVAGSLALIDVALAVLEQQILWVAGAGAWWSPG